MLMFRRLRSACAAHPRATAWAAYAVWLVALLLVLQYFHRPKLLYVFAWPVFYFPEFLVNFGILSLVFGVLYALVNSAFYAAGAVSVLVTLIGYADRMKVATLNLPLVPSDLLFVGQLGSLRGYYSRAVAVCGVVLLALGGLLWRLRKRVPHLRARRLPRAAVLLTLLAMVACEVPNHHRVVTELNRATGAMDRYWDPLQNHRFNGVLYSLLITADSLDVRAPPEYSREKIQQVLGEYEPSPGAGHTRGPNVILVMSESFWDLKEIDSLDLSFDPTPTYRRLFENGHGLRIVTPTYGGLTSETEFEVLTGLSVKYLPAGRSTFQEYVMRPLPSVARLFKRNGYYAAGVHTFLRRFWSRDRVYQLAGFDAFRAIEDLDAPEIKGLYASDHQFVKALLAETRRARGPYFIFGISMQNHGPWDTDRYTSYDVQVDRGTLSRTAWTEARNYGQGLLDADRSLQELVHFVDEQDEPTLLVFFGDHLPGTEALFRESGFFSADLSSTEESRRRYTGFGVVHANYDIPRPNGMTLSAVFMPLYLAELAGVERPPFYGFLKDAHARFPAFSRNFTAAANGAVVQQGDPALRALDATYSQIVYDVLFGGNYSGPYLP